METKQFDIGKQGLLIFGIILLLIGLVAYFYAEPITYYSYTQGREVEIGREYPYQGLGMVLVVAGILFVAIGFFYSQRKS